MKTIWLLIAAGLLASTGCTTVMLEKYSLRQTKTSGDGRDELVLNCLATVAADPNMLPPYALYATGLATVTDSATIGQTTTWAPAKYLLQNFALTGVSAPKGQWTIDPSAEYQQLEAIHAACTLALFGPEAVAAAYPNEILTYGDHFPDGKPHFAVLDRLDRTRPGWIRRGRLGDVPICARYKAHKGNTWVWIMPQDSESFAQFTLALQDIATLDPTLIARPPLIVQLTTYDITKLQDPTAEAGKNRNVMIATPEYPRAVKQEYRELIEQRIREGLKNGKVNITRAEWLQYTEPWAGVRSVPGTSPTASAAAMVGLPVQSLPTPLTLPRLPSPTFSTPRPVDGAPPTARDR